MDHPLRSESHVDLRRGIKEIFSQGLNRPRQSNIVFVCGGSEPHHMRKLFQQEFDALLPGFEFFEPEFAMKKYWTLGDDEPFDIAAFEEIVGQLSHSIVIFPEAPGSLAETGYFSAIPELARKSLLVIDSAHLATDSFISIGPGARIADKSIFRPNIQLDYANPEFQLVSQRLLDRSPPHPTRSSLSIREYSEMESFEIFAIVQLLVSILGLATIEDIEFFLRSIFSGHIKPSKVKQIVSILVGSDRLVEVGAYGHLRKPPGRGTILGVKDGYKSNFDNLRVEISAVNLTAETDFSGLLVA